MKMYAVLSTIGKHKDIPVVFKRGTFNSKFSVELGCTVFEQLKDAERAMKSHKKRIETKLTPVTTTIKEVDVNVQSLW